MYVLSSGGVAAVGGAVHERWKAHCQNTLGLFEDGCDDDDEEESSDEEMKGSKGE